MITYDSPIYFVPEDINYNLSPNVIDQIKILLSERNNVSFEYYDTIQFADVRKF